MDNLFLVFLNSKVKRSFFIKLFLKRKMRISFFLFSFFFYYSTRIRFWEKKLSKFPNLFEKFGTLFEKFETPFEIICNFSKKVQKNWRGLLKKGFILKGRPKIDSAFRFDFVIGFVERITLTFSLFFLI